MSCRLSSPPNKQYSLWLASSLMERSTARRRSFIACLTTFRRVPCFTGPELGLRRAQQYLSSGSMMLTRITGSCPEASFSS
eukprot:3544531-Rhodomonas_salina.1